MSEKRSPLRSLFDTQQELISNGQQFVESTMRLPLEMNTAVHESLAHQRRIQRETLELTHDAIDQLLDTAEQTNPGGVQVGEVRTAVDGAFEALGEGHEQVFDGIDEGYDDATAGLESAIEDLTEQVEALVALNEQLETEVVETVDGIGDGTLGETLTQQFGTLDEAVETPTESDGRERVEKQREQIETVRERIENLQHELQQSVEEAQAEHDDGTAETDGQDPDTTD